MSALAVAALSARMLAELAAEDGYDVVALDLFGDADTRQASREWLPIGAPASMKLDGERLVAALKQASGGRTLIGWIAGGGFDADAALLARAQSCVPLIGNDADVVSRVRDPRRFFATLDRMGIAHPPTQFDRPAREPGWLAKDASGTGGWHIRRARPGEPLRAHHYLQREAAGTPMSATFIANGSEAFVLGCNQLIVRPLGALPFVYRGAIGPVACAPAVGAAVSQAVRALARAFGLRGLGSLDFLLEGEEISVLELNPRPAASVSLYARRMSPGPIRAHVQACLERLLPEQVEGRPPIEGSEVIFARRALRLGDAALRLLRSAGDCHDIPCAATTIAAGDPICSITATGDDPVRLRTALKARRDALMDSLETTT